MTQRRHRLRAVFVISALIAILTSTAAAGMATAAGNGPTGKSPNRIEYQTKQHGAPPSQVRVLHKIYPDLYKREVRAVPTVWNHLRKMGASRWRASHKCVRATLSWRYARGITSSWQTMLDTWHCDKVSEWKIRFMSCIPKYEGGYGAPDVTFGSHHALSMGIAWLMRQGNIVLGHLQLRPAWFRGAMYGHPGTYQLPDRWDETLLEWAVDPVNQARATAPLSPSEYATAGYC